MISMKRFVLGLLALLLLGLLLAGCGKENRPVAEKPAPITHIPEDARGHYCGMYMYEHPGAKGQILLRDEDEPMWFSTIREVFAFTLMPDEPKAILATYVQDVSRLQADDEFPPDAWIDAHQAHYVIDSDYLGNMGVPDALPFATQEDAERFQQEHGGRIVVFDDMPEAYIFGVAAGTPQDGQMGARTSAD